ncbi:MAG TPA: GNAT family N-acetyltransferase [Thermoanaerobacterales bacterium]|nr:GNAT family N-acetyltransferase [Thermoanaerobacterales bacterium]
MFILLCIRKAVSSDYNKVEDVLKSVGFSTKYLEDNSQILVVEVDENIVGAGGITIDNENALIRFLAISPEHQRQLLGDTLVRAFINYSDRRNVKKIYVFAYDEITNFFKRIGFKPVKDSIVKASLEKQKFNTCLSKYNEVFELDIDDFFNNKSCCHK